MKVTMKATLGVEFQINPGTPENVLEASLIRGIGALRTGIAHGTGGMPTHVKPNSVKVEVIAKQVT